MEGINLSTICPQFIHRLEVVGMVWFGGGEWDS